MPIAVGEGELVHVDVTCICGEPMCCRSACVPDPTRNGKPHLYVEPCPHCMGIAAGDAARVAYERGYIRRDRVTDNIHNMKHYKEQEARSALEWTQRREERT